jgi:hypothetical protein
MKLTSETLSILKNFGIINQGIHIKKGNTLRTVSAYKNILASAEITEELPVEFGIYDLNNFLSVVSLHKDEPNFEFDDKHVYIIGNNGRSKIKYRFCDPTMIVTPPEKDLVMPDPEITFEFTNDDFNWILRAAAVLSSPQIAVESDGDSINLITLDLQNDSAHSDVLRIADGKGDSYRMVFKTENLTKILLGSYDVNISSKGIASFKNKNIELHYYVTTEQGSNYQE